MVAALTAIQRGDAYLERIVNAARLWLACKLLPEADLHSAFRLTAMTMNTLDAALVNLLIKDARLSFADIARQLNISRAHARSRVQWLVDAGVIEKFTAVVNPEKLGKMVSTFVDLKVQPARIEALAELLAEQPEVVSLYIMSDLQSLHIHTLTEDGDAFSRFASQHLLNNPDISYVDCKSLYKRIKHRRGGARL